MAFTLRRPLTLASSSLFKQATKSPPSGAIRFFSSKPPTPNFFTRRSTSPITAFARSNNAFRQSRTYMQQQPAVGINTGGLMQRLIYGGAIVGGAVLAINLVFNRETREDGGMPPF